ncbi:MAG: DoxX family protein [Armatimonadota bacterium]|nr:DoxX family protein [Armatimonadota bacterium]
MPHHSLPRYAVWAPLLLRLALGVIFFAHGSQKLLGWFGGSGMSGTYQMISSFGLPPAALWTFLLIFAEFGGGILFILGFLTRFAALMNIINMSVAIALVHARNGFFLSNGGMEYNIALIAMAVALLLTGGGALSLDRKLKLPSWL